MFPHHHGMNHMMAPSPSDFPKIKRESPGPAGFDEHNTFVEDFDGPIQGRPDAMAEDVAEDDNEDPEAAELAALELELKIRRFKAKKAKMARKSVA
jgi:hypothetical protein